LSKAKQPAEGAASRLDGNALRTQRTRSRVLAQSLALFNELGEAHVTTGMIADALDMSPGNLYYHFRNKGQIIEELFDRFEQRVDVRPRASGRAAEAIEDLWLYLHLMLEAIGEYRFIYRNLDDVVGRNRKLRVRFARIVDRQAGAIVALCESLVGSGAMQARPAQIATLAQNAIIVSTSWLGFAAATGRDGGEAAALGQGAFQVMSLFAPYLRGEARAHLDSLILEYID